MLIRESLTYLYHNIRHLTTSNTLFEIMFSLPINELLNANPTETIQQHDIENLDQGTIDEEIKEKTIDVLKARNLIYLLNDIRRKYSKSEKILIQKRIYH